MRRGRVALVGLLLIAALGLLSPRGPAQETTAPPPEEPRETKLTERVETRLAQLDVTVTGPDDLVLKLTRDDFEVSINRRQIEDFLVDRLCQPVQAEPEKEAPKPVAPPAAEASRVARAGVATYLFYFDQPHLTMAGRQGAIDIADELIPRLVRDGNRAMIVSNAKDVRTIAPLTEDVEVLLAALHNLEHDREQWDPYAEQENRRLADVQEAMGRDMNSAVSLARSYQTEERWRQEKHLSRLAMVLGRLVEMDPPKVVFYFSDTMRVNAGEHYLSFFGQTVLENEGVGAAEAMRTDAFTGYIPLDRVINEAAAHGIRFYTVEAQGMKAASTLIEGRSGAASLRNPATPGLNTVRIKDAQNTLVSLALETGGRAFLNGVPGSKIAKTVLQDLGCLYLVSFDPSGFPEDKPLTVSVRVKKPKLKAQVRGRIVLQSPSSHLTSKLLAAFSTPEATGSGIPIRAGVIPTGFRNGRFAGRVQVSIRGTALPGSAWDLGASIVTEGEVQSDVSGHVAVAQPGVPVVLERDMTFAPGPFELVAVAHEKRSDQTTAQRIESEWPKLEASLASLGPVAILQPAHGAFLRNGQQKESGPLIRGETDPLGADLPTVFLGIVCRSRDQKGPLRVERSLVGETEVPFEPLIMELGSDRCAVFQDQISQGTMTEGSFRYAVRVLDRGQEVAGVEKRFVVLGRATAAAASGS